MAQAPGLLSIAVLGVVIVTVFAQGLGDRVAALGLSDAALAALEAEHVNLAAATAPAGLTAETQTAVERAIAEAYVGGFRFTMLLSALLAAFSALAAFLFVESDRKEAGA